MTTENSTTPHVANAIDEIGQATDIIDYLTSVTQHSTSLSIENGRELILAHALERLHAAAEHLEKIAGVES